MDLERRISSTAIELVKQKRAAEGAEYRSFCEGFPVLLRTAGLAQTLAFLRAKGGTQGELYRHLTEHFERLGLQQKGGELLETITAPQTLTAQYRFYSQVALRVAYWHKRLAQALLEKKK